MARNKKPANMGEKEWNTHRLYYLAVALISQYELEDNVYQFYVEYKIGLAKYWPNLAAEYKIWCATNIPYVDAYSREQGHTVCISGNSASAASALLQFKKDILRCLIEKNANATT